MIDLAFAHGWTGLAWGYAAVQGPLIAGLIRGRANVRDYFMAPLVSAPLALVGAGGAALASGLLPIFGTGAAPVLQVALGTAISGAIGYASGHIMARAEPTDQRHIRGTRILPGSALALERTAPDARPRQLSLAGVAVPHADETKHFKLIGTTGTGKSTAIAELIGGALDRGDRMVIADPDGSYLRRFHSTSRGDVILNPFDSRSVKWDLFGEIQNSYDIEQVARALIPDHAGQDRSWRAYARTFFGAVTRQMNDMGSKDIGELYRLLVIANPSELKTLVRGTPAQPFLNEHNERMFDSIRSVTASAIGSLEHITQQKGDPMSVRQWIRETNAGALFIPYEAGQIAALRSTISAWMRLAIFETMSHGEDPGGHDDRRTWFVVDELDALEQIDGLKDALARLRKFGGRCVLGFQSIAQVSTTYGQGDAHTIVENCGNTLVLRCSASEGGGTARFASQLIGDREVVRTTTSTSRRFNEFVGARTRSEHFGVEAALLPSEIEQLPDLAGYLKLASTPHWQRVAFSPPQLAPRQTLVMPMSLQQLARQKQVPDSLEIE
jgi:type IV secretion system coupling TraD/TrwB family protein